MRLARLWAAQPVDFSLPIGHQPIGRVLITWTTRRARDSSVDKDHCLNLDSNSASLDSNSASNQMLADINFAKEATITRGLTLRWDGSDCQLRTLYTVNGPVWDSPSANALIRLSRPDWLEFNASWAASLSTQMHACRKWRHPGNQPHRVAYAFHIDCAFPHDNRIGLLDARRTTTFR